MKNRISSIMDTGRKKAGFAIICSALVITAGTGFAFAANTKPPRAVETASIAEADYSEPSPLSMTDMQRAERYGIYKCFGLTYDQNADRLYFNGEPVRYFEDFYPVGDGGYAGVDYFNESSTVDVRAVRDLTQIVINADGSYDPSGILTGVEPFSQEEYDARDIEKLLYPPLIETVAESIGDGSSAVKSNETADSSADVSAGTSYTAVYGHSITPDEYAEMYSIYEPFGVTYDKTNNRFYYEGKLVRKFLDVKKSNGKSLTGGEFSGAMTQMNHQDGEIDIRTVRDYTQPDADGHGKLTGIETD